ncbi:MAG: ribosomal RNA small subunit methyltransferase A [Candidatus Lindowbacteria bacterium]|nr:ribosomal RNA small subunit methyltransferase A [Candidatus Lindowbacteria bacterium]
MGQNYLRDRHVLERIVETVSPGDEEILEIGPGLGTLTKELAREARKITAIDAATRLAPILEETCGQFDNIKFIFKDFLHVDPSIIGSNALVGVGNLPYSITTPAIFRFLDGDFKWKRLIFVIQNEVAERIVASPGSKIYGALSVSCQAVCTTEIVRKISAGSFWPQPKVESALIEMKPNGKIRPKRLRALLRMAFSGRRKTIRNALKKIDNIEDILAQAEVSGDKRPEQIDVESWLKLGEIAHDHLEQ